MNIKINRDEFLELQDRQIVSYLIGSKLYGTEDENSDIDYLCFYKPLDLPQGYPNIHQFQYTEEGIDYIFTTKQQFWQNQMSGDSTINSDLLLFNQQANYDLSGGRNPLNLCRTYNVIKAYLGFAKRDLKLLNKSSKDKMFHAFRGLHTATCLLDNVMPELEDFQFFKEVKDLFTPEMLKTLEKEVRLYLRKSYEADLIKRYYIVPTIEGLTMKMLESNNTKEFRYD